MLWSVDMSVAQKPRLSWYKISNTSWNNQKKKSMSRFHYKQASRKNTNAVNLMVTAPPMEHLGIISIFYAYLVLWDFFSGLTWKFPSHTFFTNFFIGAGLTKSAEGKKKRFKDIQQRANDLGMAKKISYLQIRVGIIDMVCIIDFCQRNRLFPHHFLYPPASALCVTFTAFGSANSVRSMTTPRSQEHRGWRVSATSDIDQL